MERKQGRYSVTRLILPLPSVKVETAASHVYKGGLEVMSPV